MSNEMMHRSFQSSLAAIAILIAAASCNGRSGYDGPFNDATAYIGAIAPPEST